MFNPQRKSKVSDIFMEERSFQLHLDKVNKIRQSYSLTARRGQNQQQQQTYLQRLQTRRKQVKDKLTKGIRQQNHRLLDRLNATDNRQEANPEKIQPEKHFSSYYNSKVQNRRIKQQNMNMLNRMVHKSSAVPTLQQMKKQYKQSQRYGKMVSKLPTIMKHEDQFKRQLSTRRLMDSNISSRGKINSKMSSRSGHSSRSRKKTLGEGSSTQQIRSIENTLLAKAD